MTKAPCKEIYRWNAAIKSYVDYGEYRYALLLYHQMLKSSITPQNFTFSLVIKACTSFSAIKEAIQIHTHVLKYGFGSCLLLGTALLDLYSRCGYVLLARQMFDEMPNRDVVALNALVSGYSYNGYDFEALELFSETLRGGTTNPVPTTLISVLPCCSNREFLWHGKSVHGYGIKTMLASDPRVMNALTSMYAKCLDLEAAWFLFESLAEKSAISWNIMISAYGQNAYFSEALALFNRMRSEGLLPTSVTIISLLATVTHSNSLQHGISIHCYAVRTGFDADTCVITSLVCMYAKCGNSEAASSLYASMAEKNMVSSTAIISCYVENGYLNWALQCFSWMQRIGMKVDAVTMISVLVAFTDPSYLEMAMTLHGRGIKSGLASDILVMNGLISAYTRCGDMGTAFSLFHEMPERPPITWNSMISGCVQTGRSIDALVLFHQMQLFGQKPDLVTIVSALSGCSHLGLLHMGKGLHTYVLRNNLELGAFICTALIDMYAKCGSIKSAKRVFQNMKEPPSLATLNAMILAFGLCGMEGRAFESYDKIIEQGLRPDDITFIGVLSACSHAGLVAEGRRYLRAMREEFNMVPGVEHCACMVDLLGCAGCFDEAVVFIKGMEVEPDSVVWGALLGGCCVHRNVRLGECVAKRLFLADYHSTGLYVLMSNLYAAAGRWDDVASVRNVLRDIGGGDGFSGCRLTEAACSMRDLQEIVYIS